MPKNSSNKKLAKRREADGLPESLDQEMQEQAPADAEFLKTDELIAPSLTNDLLAAEKSGRAGGGKVWMACMLLGLVAGIAGGVAGAVYLAPWLQSGMSGIQGENGQEIKRVILDENSAIIEVVKEANPAVVSIIVAKDLPKVQQYYYGPFGDLFEPFSLAPDSGSGLRQIGAGSGFIVSANGLILTNKHVVADEKAEYTVILSSGEKYPGRVLALDPLNDLAVLKIDAENLPFAQLGDSSKVELGQRVIAIGNSLGELSNTVTTGVISGIGRTVSAGDGSGAVEQLQEVFQTDAAINPGNSGGPLLSLAGQVIGVNTAIDRSGQLIGFAIPSAEAGKVLADVQKFGRVLRPFVGVRYIVINAEYAKANGLPVEQGALILPGEGKDDVAIVPGSPAENAGLRENDIILEVSGKVIDGQHTLSSVLKSYRPDDQIVLKILRGTEEKEVLLTLGEAK